MANETTWNFVNKEWDDNVVPLMKEYIKIPNVSPIFDETWETNGACAAFAG